MAVVRVVARMMDEDYDEDKIVFIGSIDNQQKLRLGEWMGYCLEDGAKYPCILVRNGNVGQFDFAGWETWNPGDVARPHGTNIFDRPITVGEYFTIKIDEDEFTCRIESVTPLP